MQLVPFVSSPMCVENSSVVHIEGQHYHNNLQTSIVSHTVNLHGHTIMKQTIARVESSINQMQSGLTKV